MILQILNLLIPLVRKFLNEKAIQTNQNYWNVSSVAVGSTKEISREEVFNSISKIPVQRDPIFHLPVSTPHITSPYGWRYLNIDGKNPNNSILESILAVITMSSLLKIV